MQLSNSPVGPARGVRSGLGRVRMVFGDADLILAGACAGPHESVGAQVALDVSGDDFASDALAGDEPLVRARRHDG